MNLRDATKIITKADTGITLNASEHKMAELMLHAQNNQSSSSLSSDRGHEGLNMSLKSANGVPPSDQVTVDLSQAGAIGRMIAMNTTKLAIVNFDEIYGESSDKNQHDLHEMLKVTSKTPLNRQKIISGQHVRDEKKHARKGIFALSAWSYWI